MHGLRSASSWIKSTTANACIPRSVIVHHWSSSTNCGAPKLWGEDRHEFSEAWGIYRSEEVGSTGSKRSGLLPVLIGRDEFQPVVPWQVALQQSLPLLRRPRAILQNQTSPYNDFSANGDNPLNSVSQHKGALQSVNPLIGTRPLSRGEFDQGAVFSVLLTCPHPVLKDEVPLLYCHPHRKRKNRSSPSPSHRNCLMN